MTDHGGDARGAGVTADTFSVVVDGDDVAIRPETTVADVKARIGAAANTVFTYEEAGRIHVLEHADVIADHVADGTELTVLPVTDHYPQLEQDLQRLREHES